MASYKDVLKLVREGKTLAEIQAALPMSPYRMRRLLDSGRLKAAMEMDRQFSELLARQRLARAMDHLVDRRLQIIDADDGETARKAAESLAQQHQTAAQTQTQAEGGGAEFTRQQKLEFLLSLVKCGAINVNLILKNLRTGRYGFEDIVLNNGKYCWEMDEPEDKDDESQEDEDDEEEEENEEGEDANNDATLNRQY